MKQKLTHEKNTALYSIHFFTKFLSAQTSLENKYKVELGLQDVSIGTEVPINNVFLSNINLDWRGFLRKQLGIFIA